MELGCNCELIVFVFQVLLPLLHSLVLLSDVLLYQQKITLEAPPLSSTIFSNSLSMGRLQALCTR